MLRRNGREVMLSDRKHEENLRCTKSCLLGTQLLGKYRKAQLATQEIHLLDINGNTTYGRR